MPAPPIAELPSIAIVTPSFNQARWLEAAMLSVLDQGYARLQYVVQDGGSTDGSVEIIRRHETRLRAWSSAPDGGQYAAVAAGFAQTDAEILGWLNSDDLHCPWALAVVGEIFARFPEVQWLTSARPLFWDAAGRAVDCLPLRGFTRAGFRAGEHLPRAGRLSRGFVQQESTFWRRGLWEQAGGFDARFPLAGDFALWGRFFEHAPLHAVETPLAGFRRHEDQKTGHDFEGYLAEAERALHAAGGRRRGRAGELLRRVCRYRAPVITWDLVGEKWRRTERAL